MSIVYELQVSDSNVTAKSKIMCYYDLLYKHQCFIGISATEKIYIFSHVKIRYFHVQKYQPIRNQEIFFKF